MEICHFVNIYPKYQERQDLKFLIFDISEFSTRFCVKLVTENFNNRFEPQTEWLFT